jgi:hypothetical protein
MTAAAFASVSVAAIVTVMAWGWETLGDDVITQTDTPSAQSVLTPDNCDDTGAILKGHILVNSPER